MTKGKRTPVDLDAVRSAREALDRLAKEHPDLIDRTDALCDLVEQWTDELTESIEIPEELRGILERMKDDTE